MKFLLLIIFTSIAFSSQGDLYFNKGLKYKNNLQVADSMFIIAIEKFKNEQNIEGVAKSIYYRGFCADLKGDLTKALKFYFQCKSLSETSTFDEYYLKSNSKISFILSKNNLITQALYYNNQSINFIKNSNQINNYLLSKAYSEKAGIHLNSKNFSKALNILKKVSLNNDDYHFKNTYYNLLGRVYFELGNYDLALYNYDKALELDPQSKIAQLNKLELMYLQDNKKFDYLLESYEKLENDASDYLIKREKILYAKVDLKNKNFESALSKISELIVYSEKKNLLEMKIEATEVLNDIYIAMQDYENVLATSNLLKEMYATQNIKSLEFSSKILTDINRIESENELLSKENENLTLKYYFSIAIALLFIILSFLFWKYKYTRSYSEGFIVDYYIIVDKMKKMISRQMNELLNRNMKTLVLNYDLDQDEVLFRNLDDIVNVKNAMERELDKSKQEIYSNKEAIKVLKLDPEKKISN